MTMRILVTNVGDSATASATTAASGYPASNLQTVSRDEEFRTSSDADTREIKLTWSTNQSINCVALCRLNLGSAATIRYDLYSDTAWTTGLVNSGTLTAFDTAAFGASQTFNGNATLRGLKNHVWYPTAQTTVKSLKITLSNDSSNPDNYFAATRLFAGNYIPFSRDASYGLTLAWAEKTEQTRMDSGALRSTAITPAYRRISAANRYVPAADRLLWSDVYRAIGLRYDMWVDIYAGDTTAVGTDHRGQFKFESVGGIAHELPAHWSTQYVLTEA
jgi:hypothetical protein